MNFDMNRAARLIKAAAHPAKMAAVMGLGLSMLVILECYSAWYAFASAPGGDLWATPFGPYPRAALLHSGLSIVCGLSAFIGMAIAGALKDDERKHIAGRAWAARAVALSLLLVPAGPIANLAGAFALDKQAKTFEVYKTSPAYTADIRTLEDVGSDPVERREAQYRVTPPTGDADLPDWLTAVFLHVLVMWSAAAFRLAPPITEEERAAIRLAEAQARLTEKRKEAARKGAATRKAKAQAARPQGVVQLFGRK